jgi:hypothetical protein
MKSIIRIEPLLFLFFLVFVSCDRFPRDNPIDPANIDGGESDRGPAIVLAEQPTIDDALEYDEWNNRNGVVEPGETIRFVAELMNKGDETARNVAADISSTSSCVVSSTVRSTVVGSARYGDIESGRTGPSFETAGSFSYEVVFSTTECSVGDTVEISLEVRDDSDNHWDIPLEFEIVESDANIEIVLDEIDIKDDKALSDCNNSDSDIERGETVQITIPIRNTGDSLARGLHARLLSQSTNCVVFPQGIGDTSESLFYGDLRPGRSSQPFDADAPDDPAYFTLEADVDIDGCEAEGDLVFRMVVEDVSNRTWEVPLTINRLVERSNEITYRSVVFDDNPEFGNGNGNGVAELGETFHLTIDLVNHGQDLACSIALRVDPNQNRPSCITTQNFNRLRATLLSYGDIESGFDQPLDLDDLYFEVVLSRDGCEKLNLKFIATDGCGVETDIIVPIIN